MPFGAPGHRAVIVETGDVDALVAGVDFGTSGVRVVIVDPQNGAPHAVAAEPFPEWERGRYCDPPAQSFRQHPRELIDSFHRAAAGAVAQLPVGMRSRIRAVSVDTTGSSPTAIASTGVPLAMSSDTFAEDPDAMVVLWKDHTAEVEAARIERSLGVPYASEWFWAKILHIVETNGAVASAAVTWAEHADWFPAYLCGNRDPATWKRCRGGAAHKALWGHGGSRDGHRAQGGAGEFAGYPSAERLGRISPYLATVVNTLGSEVWSPGLPFGRLCTSEATATGLPPGIPVGVGSFDAHTAALAAGVRPGTIAKIIGTSSSDMVVTDLPLSRGFPGVESVAVGSIVPDLVTIESGQAAYGDLAEWLVSLLEYGIDATGRRTSTSDNDRRNDRSRIFGRLEAEAGRLAFQDAPVALDWWNGRRSPHGDLSVTGALSGLRLANGPPALYFSLWESAAFATRTVHEHLRNSGVAIDEIAAIGGVPDRSDLAMRILADVLNHPVSVRESANASAHGAAIYAAVAAGIHPDVSTAQAHMQVKERTTVRPEPSRAALHVARYRRYRELAGFQERLERATTT